MIIKYTSMDALISCLKHNMAACLEKTKRNAQFHEIVDFLRRSSIYYSLTVSPTVSTSLIEQFWNTTTSKIVNEVSHVTPLFSNMLAQAVVDEGEGSTQPTKPQPTPSPTQPSIGDQPPVTESSYRPNTTQDPSVNFEGTGGSQRDHVQIPHDSPLQVVTHQTELLASKIIESNNEVSFIIISPRSLIYYPL
ncbi:hypothetical protein Tco_1019506 [Tanacetum coccineum]|uniref:Uncharacterized protein n=1 Tax=Tanacetum coccineum TaxID=301880 RepID=A0ABQ5FXB7_9ASTR